MSELLFVVRLKPKVLAEYRKFLEEISQKRVGEYRSLLKKLGVKTSKIWHKKIDGKEYAFVLHDLEKKAEEMFDIWASLNAPFEIWFKEQLDSFYEDMPETVEELFNFTR